jgi:hypothetical protein
MTAIRVMIGLATVLALPVVSAILRHAAAVLVQRQPGLNLLQVLDLADSGWERYPRKGATKLTIAGFALIILSEY